MQRTQEIPYFPMATPTRNVIMALRGKLIECQTYSKWVINSAVGILWYHYRRFTCRAHSYGRNCLAPPHVLESPNWRSSACFKVLKKRWPIVSLSNTPRLHIMHFYVLNPIATLAVITHTPGRFGWSMS